MADIFGLDLAGIVNDAINDAGGLIPLTLLTRTGGTRTTGDPAGGRNATESPSTGQGIIEDYLDDEIDGTVVRQGDRRVLIMGASLPSGVVPSTNDSVTIEGRTYKIVGPVKRDPAAASYTCQARG